MYNLVGTATGTAQSLAPPLLGGPPTGQKCTTIPSQNHQPQTVYQNQAQQ